MLSILIPVYNCDVNNLVLELYKQSIDLNIDFEILIIDDFSKKHIKEKNKPIGLKNKIEYKELLENIGRSRIRNLLGKSAKFDNIIFLDCDSAIPSPLFIRDYLTASKAYQIVYGGTIYLEKPKNQKKILHWTFGTQREVKPASIRNKKPSISFTSNNFLIKKDVLLDHLFDETIRGYGYEDLVFSARLKTSNYKVHHIDNPVIHLGLEDTDKYLLKLEKSLENLVILQKKGMLKNTRLTLFYKKVKLYKLMGVVLFLFNWKKNSILANLNSRNPKLRNLDIYKLVMYHSYKKE